MALTPGQSPQMRVFACADNRPRSITSPERRLCSSVETPEYSAALDRSNLVASPLTLAAPDSDGIRIRWMYWTVSPYSCIVRKARSKKRPCHSSPVSPPSALVELSLRDFIVAEMVGGCGGNRMACPAAAGRAKAPRPSAEITGAGAHGLEGARQNRKVLPSSGRRFGDNFTVGKKKRSERTRRRRRDTVSACKQTGCSASREAADPTAGLRLPTSNGRWYHS